jgi:hypothetical protein
MPNVNLEDNEFDNFLKLKRKGGIFDRLAKCSKEAQKGKYSDKEVKKKFVQDCMKKSGKADDKSQLLKREKATEKIKLANEKRKEENKKRNEEMVNTKPQERKADPRGVGKYGGLYILGAIVLFGVYMRYVVYK